MLLPFVSGHIIKQIWTDPEGNIRLYGPRESNIAQGRRPRAILLSLGPYNLILPSGSVHICIIYNPSSQQSPLSVVPDILLHTGIGLSVRQGNTSTDQFPDNPDTANHGLPACVLLLKKAAAAAAAAASVSRDVHRGTGTAEHCSLTPGCSLWERESMADRRHTIR